MPLRVQIVTAEREVYAGDADVVIAPGVEGELAVLPNHAPLLTTLKFGELRTRRGNDEQTFAIGGGFLEVRPDRVVVLADMAERADEIDASRAAAARQRAQQRIAERQTDMDLARAQASLQRSLIRLEVAERLRRRRGATGAPPPPGMA